MTADIPNTFVQTDIPREMKREKIIMKIQSSLVDMLIKISSNEYENFIHYETQQRYCMWKKC